MKKGISFFIGLGIVCFLFAGNSFAQNLKVGYVDIGKVFSSYYKTQQDVKIWQNDQTSQETKLEKLQTDLKTLQDKYNKQKNLLKPEEIQKMKVEIGKKNKELVNLANQANQTLTTEKDNMITKLKKEIYGEIKNFAQENKYDLILDSQAVIFSSGDDLTNQIITILNKNENKTTK